MLHLSAARADLLVQRRDLLNKLAAVNVRLSRLDHEESLRYRAERSAFLSAEAARAAPLDPSDPIPFG